MKIKFPFFVALLLLMIAIPGYAQEDAEFLLVDDFENGVPLFRDTFGNSIGLVPWGDVEGNITLSATQVASYSNLILPGQSGANTVLAVAYDIGGWGGFTHAFTDGENWTSQDWTDYDALRFWLYGNDTGGTVQIDLFDNRNPEIDNDSAERFYYRITDDYSGWQQFTIHLQDFQRRTDFQPSGAPDDGLGLDEVSGYAFGFPAGVGAQVAYLDQVVLVTDAFVEQEAGEIAATEEAEQHEESEMANRTWQLIWEDDFDGEADTPPNPDNWTCEIGGHGWGNQEWEYYTNRVENVSHNGSGSLAITARQENPDDYSCWYGTCTHTSARCITRDKFEFTYGRVEARIRVPFGQGIWPAFWMLGANFDQVGWPASGEIDILENIGREPRTVHGTVHGPGYSGANGITALHELDENLSDDYHLYAVEWDVDEIRWYIDDLQYATLTPDRLIGRTWVFDHDFFILLNVAVGGVWPGYPDDTTVFPQTMLVDYVRVYQYAEGE